MRIYIIQLKLYIYIVYLDQILVYRCKKKIAMKKDFNEFIYFIDIIYDLIVN